MYNQIQLIGHLTRDIEVRYAQSGTTVASTGIATSHKWKDQSGQQKEEVMFIDVTFFGKSGEIANQYLHKGSKVFISGRLKLDQWTGQDGTKRSKHAVVVQEMKMLDCRQPQGQQHQAQPQQQQPQYQPQQQAQPQQQYQPQQPQQQQAQPQQQYQPQVPDMGGDEPLPF
jgi:single-strand DNA-binding protein